MFLGLSAEATRRDEGVSFVIVVVLSYSILEVLSSLNWRVFLACLLASPVKLQISNDTDTSVKCNCMQSTEKIFFLSHFLFFSRIHYDFPFQRLYLTARLLTKACTSLPKTRASELKRLSAVWPSDTPVLPRRSYIDSDSRSPCDLSCDIVISTESSAKKKKTHVKTLSWVRGDRGFFLGFSTEATGREMDGADLLAQWFPQCTEVHYLFPAVGLTG